MDRNSTLQQFGQRVGLWGDKLIGFWLFADDPMNLDLYDPHHFRSSVLGFHAPSSWQQPLGFGPSSWGASEGEFLHVDAKQKQRELAETEGLILRAKFDSDERYRKTALVSKDYFLLTGGDVDGLVFISEILRHSAEILDILEKREEARREMQRAMSGFEEGDWIDVMRYYSDRYSAKVDEFFEHLYTNKKVGAVILADIAHGYTSAMFDRAIRYCRSIVGKSKEPWDLACVLEIRKQLLMLPK